MTYVILIKVATAAFDKAGMQAVHDVNGPRFAHHPDHRRAVGLLPAARERRAA